MVKKVTNADAEKETIKKEIRDSVKDMETEDSPAYERAPRIAKAKASEICCANICMVESLVKDIVMEMETTVAA